MKMKARKLLDAIVYFFNFRKPAFLAFSCIDLVADHKLLFLLAWELTNARRINIHPGKNVYRCSGGAAIITLPPATASVKIVASNWWRKTTMSIELRHVTLNKESIGLLTSDLRLFTRIEVEALMPAQLPGLPQVRLDMPEIRAFSFQTTMAPTFNYQNFAYYES